MENSPHQHVPPLPAAAVAVTPGSTLTSLLPMGAAAAAAGNGKRALDDAAAMESKRLKRLEKNRESARECRRRKKENKGRMEAQLASLEEENLDLRLRLKVGDEAEDAENAEILEIKERLNDMVSKGAGEGQILQTMDLLTERFADYGSAHTSAAEFHLAQLSRLLLPTLTTRVCMHAVLQTKTMTQTQKAAGAGLEGGASREHEAPPVEKKTTSTLSTRLSNGRSVPDGASPSPAAVGNSAPTPGYSPECGVGGGGTVGERKEQGSGGQKAATALGGTGMADGGAVDMWTSLVDVLEATGEQQADMQNQAGAIAELARDLEGTTQIMDRLRLLLADRNQTLDGEMAAIQRILTPTQSAKFVLWVSKNKACVHMLNQLWDKLHGGNAEPEG
eukprot:g7892.t1